MKNNYYRAAASVFVLACLAGCKTPKDDSANLKDMTIVYTRPGTPVSITLTEAAGPMGSVNRSGDFTQAEINVIFTVLDSFSTTDLLQSGLKTITPVVADPSIIPKGGYTITKQGIVVYFKANANVRAFDSSIGNVVFAAVKALLVQNTATSLTPQDTLTSPIYPAAALPTSQGAVPQSGGMYVGSESPATYQPVEQAAGTTPLSQLGQKTSDVHPVTQIPKPKR